MFPTLKLGLFLVFWNYIKPKGVLYGYGKKFLPLKDATPEERRVDCSGFFRWIIFHASRRVVTPPDGSWMQRAWCKSEGFESCHYATAIKNRTNGIYACFYHPPSPSVGHVWIVRNGIAYQSSAGKGINSTRADEDWFLSHCHACYKIA